MHYKHYTEEKKDKDREREREKQRQTEEGRKENQYILKQFKEKP